MLYFRKIKFKFLVIICLFIILLPFATLIIGHRIRNFCFREIAYSMITKKIINENNSELSKAVIIYKFISNNVSKPEMNKKSIDTTPLETLFKGIGSCDQQADLMITIARFLGIKGYLIFLYNQNSKISNHSSCVLSINKKLILFDTFYKNIFFVHSFFNLKNMDKKSLPLEINTIYSFKKKQLIYNRFKVFKNNKISKSLYIFRIYTRFWTNVFDKTLLKYYLSFFIKIENISKIKEEKILKILFNNKLSSIKNHTF
jgi:hypothetical protein